MSKQQPAGDRRRLKAGLDRRRFSYAAYSPERRIRGDRRREPAGFFPVEMVPHGFSPPDVTRP